MDIYVYRDQIFQASSHFFRGLRTQNLFQIPQTQKNNAGSEIQFGYQAFVQPLAEQMAVQQGD